MTPVTVPGRPRVSRAVPVAAVAAKLVLFALLVAAVFWPDLSGLKGKASGARLVVYPLGAMVLPAYWYLRYRGRRAFPWLDDLMHFALWALLTAGVLLAVTAGTTSRGLTVMVALGFGTTAAVIWELGEYVTFVRHSAELQTAYTDTLGDLALGTLGALLAGLVVGQVRRSVTIPRP